MPKKFIKKLLPDYKQIRNHKHLQIFGRLIHDPNLWHLNRYSVATAFTVGLFCAFLPIPFQMVVAAALAIIVRANLPISVALVWITNPLTWVPIYGIAYVLGAKIIGLAPRKFYFEPSFSWIIENFFIYGGPTLLGGAIIGIVTGALSNIGIRLIWRYSIAKNWRERIKKRKDRIKARLRLTKAHKFKLKNKIKAKLKKKE